MDDDYRFVLFIIIEYIYLEIELKRRWGFFDRGNGLSKEMSRMCRI